MRSLFLVILIVLPVTLQAQTFTPISAGSSYYCANTGGLYTLSNGSYLPVASKAAKKAVSTDLSYFRKRIQTLNEIRKDVKNKLADRDLARFAKLIGDINKKGIDHVADLPEDKEARLDAIDALKTLLNLRIALRKAELKGIKNCDDGKNSPGPSSFSAQVISAQDGIDTIVGALVLTQAKAGKINYKARWFCVALPHFTGFAPRLFSVNPCANGGQAIANCSALVPKGMLGYIETFTTYGSTPSEDSLNNSINQANEKLSRGPILGRVRGKTGAVGSDVTDRDRCD